jgi:hypothetical protein
MMPRENVGTTNIVTIVRGYILDFYGLINLLITNKTKPLLASDICAKSTL